MPATVSNVLFFITRGVSAAGNGLTGIYASNVFQTRVRSLASGLCAAAYRLGILTAPYVGQILLQDRSALLAILTFALVAVAGALGSLILPKTRAPYSVRKYSPTLLMYSPSWKSSIVSDILFDAMENFINYIKQCKNLHVNSKCFLTFYFLKC